MSWAAQSILGRDPKAAGTTTIVHYNQLLDLGRGAGPIFCEKKIRSQRLGQVQMYRIEFSGLWHKIGPAVKSGAGPA